MGIRKWYKNYINLVDISDGQMQDQDQGSLRDS